MAISRRRSSNSNLAAALFSIAFGLATLAAGEPSAWLCGITGNFTATSSFQHNLQNLAADLPNLTASSPNLFASAAVGDTPEAVNAAAFCRGDSEPSECRACVATAFLDAQATCLYVKDVTLFEDLCSLRFSNEKIFGSRINDGNKFKESTSHRRVVDHAQDFGAAVNVLLNNTLEHAAASYSRFGTATQGFGNLDIGIASMYSMAQCAPSLSSRDCHTCLSQLLRRMPDFYRGLRDGKMLLWDCFFQFDDQQFFNGRPTLSLPPLPRRDRRGERRKRVLLEIIIPTAVVTVLILVIGFLLIKKRRKTAGKVELQLQGPLHSQNSLWQIENSSGFTSFNFSDLAATTGHFSDENRLGSGGFGAVYKGKLGDGAEIAVKRLSSHSRQGLEQFKNEVELIVKLQHTNLVRLIGCCVHGAEKLLVYEYMPNGSLNSFIFNQQRGALLDWEKRLNIIEGIAQGLRYLHEHSRVRIVHRDLKTSNILLDGNMKPKISDFGLARVLPSNVSEAKTNRVAGTYGYMAPEYFYGGTFSVKSDIYSFGVLLLEVISGKRNNGNDQYGGFSDLLEYAWHLWREGKMFELIDPTLGVCGQVMTSVERCIKLALLCVQDRARDRPTIADVTAMLVGRDGTTSMPDPRRPQQLSSRGITTHALEIRCGSHGTRSCATNGVTITSIQGR